MKKKTIDRRQMLKLMMVSGGALAVNSFVPTKWLKPLVSSGVLPVHAQTSTAPLGLCDPDQFGTIELVWNGDFVNPKGYIKFSGSTIPAGTLVSYEVTAVVPGVGSTGIKVGDTSSSSVGATGNIVFDKNYSFTWEGGGVTKVSATITLKLTIVGQSTCSKEFLNVEVSIK